MKSEEDRIDLKTISDQIQFLTDGLNSIRNALGALNVDQGLTANSALSSGTPLELNGDLEPHKPIVRARQSAFPDPRRVRQAIRNRRLRAKFFGDDLFGEPCWDMILDLTAACAENKRISVTSLCLASGVPSTTALRWIAVLVERGIIRRTEDPADRRRSYLELSRDGIKLVNAYFNTVDQSDENYFLNLM